MNPCSPSPCGANAVCDNGACSCLPEYFGDPYFACKPECVLNSDCPRDKACIRNKCNDPCIGTCGVGAISETINHIPMCSCPQGFTGTPFHYCNEVKGKIEYVCGVVLYYHTIKKKSSKTIPFSRTLSTDQFMWAVSVWPIQSVQGSERARCVCLRAGLPG